jgi:hypothetical protein
VISNYRAFQKKLKIIVIRTDKNGNLRDSKPCVHCLENMKFFGIKTVYYSTNEGTMEKVKTEDISGDHLSGRQNSFYRFLKKEKGNKDKYSIFRFKMIIRDKEGEG